MTMQVHEMSSQIQQPQFQSDDSVLEVPAYNSPCLGDSIDVKRST